MRSIAFEHAPKILSGGRDIDVDHAPQLVVVHLGGRFRSCVMLLTASSLAVRAAGRESAGESPKDPSSASNLAFRILHGQQVVVARPMVHPVAGRDHLVRSQRRDDVLDDLLSA